MVQIRKFSDLKLRFLCARNISISASLSVGTSGFLALLLKIERWLVLSTFWDVWYCVSCEPRLAKGEEDQNGQGRRGVCDVKLFKIYENMNCPFTQG